MARTRQRWVVGTAGLVLVVLVFASAAALALSAWANGPAGRQWVEVQLSRILERRVTLAGGFSLSWETSRHDAWYRLPSPVLVAHQVTIANPAWASHTEFATADRVRVRIALAPLLQRRLVLRRVALDNARLQLERNAAGLDNWQFGSDDTGGTDWTIELQSLRLGATTLRYTDTGLDLDLEASLTAASADDRDDATAFTVRGHYRKAAIAGDGTAGALLSLVDPAVNYPFHLDLHAGEVYVNAQGRVGNVDSDPAVDLQVQVKGPSMALLYPLTGLVLPRTAPFETSGRLQGTLGERQALWHYRDFRGRMGESDIAGDLTYQSRQTRPLLTARVESQQLQIVDLGPLIGLGELPEDPAAGTPAPRPDQRARVFPDLPFLAERWGDMDLSLDYRAALLVHGPRTITRDLTARVELRDRQMQIEPLAFQLGGGNVDAHIALDGREHPVAGHARLQLHQVAIEQVLGAADARADMTGTLRGQLDLSGHGNSLAALLGSGSGTLRLDLGAGHIRRSALELVALDLLNVAFTKAFGDDIIPITCATAQFDVRQGVAHSRNVQLQTSIAYLDVTGSVNLGNETLALTIHPHTLAPRLFSLRSPIDIRGSFLHPQIKVQEGPLLLRAGAAAALALLAPPALALLPLTTLGSDKPAPCHLAPDAH